MICPKCGYENLSTAINCANCKINIEWAASNLDSFQLDEQTRAILRKEIREKSERYTNFTITTTPNIQGKDISEYIGVISSFVVLGTGLASDIGAIVGDALGMRVTELENKFYKAEQDALDILHKKAVDRGGDGIVGLEYNIMPLAFNTVAIGVTGTVVRLSTPITEVDKLSGSSE